MLGPVGDDDILCQVELVLVKGNGELISGVRSCLVAGPGHGVRSGGQVCPIRVLDGKRVLQNPGCLATGRLQFIHQRLGERDTLSGDAERPSGGIVRRVNVADRLGQHAHAHTIGAIHICGLGIGLFPRGEARRIGKRVLARIGQVVRINLRLILKGILLRRRASDRVRKPLFVRVGRDVRRDHAIHAARHLDEPFDLVPGAHGIGDRNAVHAERVVVVDRHGPVDQPRGLIRPGSDLVDPVLGDRGRGAVGLRDTLRFIPSNGVLEAVGRGGTAVFERVVRNLRLVGDGIRAARLDRGYRKGDGLTGGTHTQAFRPRRARDVGKIRAQCVDDLDVGHIRIRSNLDGISDLIRRG